MRGFKRVKKSLVDTDFGLVENLPMNPKTMIFNPFSITSEKNQTLNLPQFKFSLNNIQ